MVCMIADYKQKGEDRNGAFIIPAVDDWDIAVPGLAKYLEGMGMSVQAVTVIPGEYTIEKLTRISESPDELPRGVVPVVHVFDDNMQWETVGRGHAKRTKSNR